MKDRAACSMIREGERQGALRPGKIILDATSGNTGIAYAMIGAALGYRVKSVAAHKRIGMELEADPASLWGRDSLFTPGGEGTDGAIRRVREIYDADPDKYFYPNQYGNPANPAAHYSGTALWRSGTQTRGKITPLCREASGTSRNASWSTTRKLKELNPRACVASVCSRIRASTALKDSSTLETAIVQVHLRSEAGGRKPLP